MWGAPVPLLLISVHLAVFQHAGVWSEILYVCCMCSVKIHGQGWNPQWGETEGWLDLKQLGDHANRELLSEGIHGDPLRWSLSCKLELPSKNKTEPSTPSIFCLCDLALLHLILPGCPLASCGAVRTPCLELTSYSLKSFVGKVPQTLSCSGRKWVKTAPVPMHSCWKWHRCWSLKWHCLRTVASQIILTVYIISTATILSISPWVLAVNCSHWGDEVLCFCWLLLWCMKFNTLLVEMTLEYC